MKMVGVILINYKDYAKRYLAACRDSLRCQTYQDFRVYLVDNASTADSIACLKEMYPEATILPRPDGNYCAGNNVGMRAAIADGCAYLVAANMDTVFEPDWLKELTAALENQPAAGVAQSLILLYPKTEAERTVPLINTTGNLIHFLFFGFTNNYAQPQSSVSLVGYPEISGYASGCSLMIRREVYELIGGYEESYYMYHDDLDISLKVRLAGFKIILAPRSVVWHKYEFSRSVRMLYYMERNRAICFFAFYPLGSLLLLLPVWLIMSLGMALYSIIGGWFGTKLRVTGYFFTPAGWREVRHMRREYRRLRHQSWSQITDSFVGRIEFQEIANPILKYLVNPLFDIYWRLVKKII
jgi:GT2 family glycosyltransferase